jgi:glycosyltransferase involved in cell wall biosynthesis
VSKPLRILTIGHSHVVALNRAMWRELAQDRNFEITVAAPSSFQGDLRPLTIDPEPTGSPLNLVPLDAKWTGRIHIFRYHDGQLRKLMREGNFDVVHAWEEPYIYAGYQIARSLRDNPARFVFRTAQNLVKQYPPPFSYFERYTLRRAQAWVAGGNLVFETRLQHGYPKDRGRILSLAVDLTAFHPLLDAQRRQVLDELGIQPPVIGFLGRLSADKGLDVLMQAVELLPASARWNLLLLGSGPYKTKVEAWARAKGWQHRVHIKLVKHEDAPRHVAAMDMLVAPSQTTSHWREQFGRMIVEAFASGVPVIGSDSGEIPFVIADAGLVVPERDPAAWAKAIQELLQDAEARRVLAQRGLQRAGQYSCSSVAAQFAEFYRWVAQQPLTSAPAREPLQV